MIRLTAFCIALFGTFGRIIFSLRGEMGADVLFYFTIQSNLMVCLFLGLELLDRDIITRPALQGAVLMYITITGLVYNILLAPGWEPSGMNLLISTINHSITPLLFVLDWILSQSYGSYRIRHLFYWLIYPFLYAVAASIEGALTGRFRYFFMDFVNQGRGEYLLMMLMVTMVFLFLGVVIIKFNNLNLNRREHGNGTSE